MDVLDQLSVDQKTLIISLPYRVGLWVSQCDATGGREADEKELTVLSNILQGFSEQVFGSELLQYIMDETTKRREHWDEWSGDMEIVPSQCERALDILREYVDEKDVNAYAQRLMEIGEAVALAFREEHQSGAKIGIYFSYLSAALKARLSKQPFKSFDQYLNISMHERKALLVLAGALSVRYII